MLKLATEEEERFGGVLMEWWDGDGAARVLARDDDALLLERAEGTASLADMARNGRDDEACRILCAVAARLHAPGQSRCRNSSRWQHWFRELQPAAAAHGGLLVRCAETARALLAEPREVGVLHGDLHHDNVLDFGVRGWLAIDPKRLVGERGFDFANIFTNPDLADPTPPGSDRAGPLCAAPGGRGRSGEARARAPAALDSRLDRTVGGVVPRRRRFSRYRPAGGEVGGSGAGPMTVQFAVDDRSPYSSLGASSNCHFSVDVARHWAAWFRMD